MTARQIDRLPSLRRDPGFVGASLAELPAQLQDGWEHAQGVRLPKTYGQASSIVVAAMGGSPLGADIARSVLSDRLRLPVTIVSGYQLPSWVNHSSIVVCVSYSGSTEETLAAFSAAKQKRAHIIVVASGGPLTTVGWKFRYPVYQFRPHFNPSNQPRLGTGYLLMSMLACWRLLGVAHISKSEIQALVTSAQRAGHAYGVKRAAKSNPAKRLAIELHGKIPFLMGAEWTAGNLHTWANQLHENAKTMAVWDMLPDLNHHWLEGLRNRSITKQVQVVMVRDAEYHPRNLKRLTLTKKIIEDLGAKVSVVTPVGKTKLEKAIDLLAFGGYVSWYLSALRKVNPAPIPTVDWLKQKLAK